jgi:hypothetical protein
MGLQRRDATGPTLGVYSSNGTAYRLVEPGVADESGVDGEPCAELSAHRAEFGLEPSEVGPSMAWVDVVGRHRGDATQIVDACCDELAERAGQEVRRRLKADLGGEQTARECDDPKKVVG